MRRTPSCGHANLMPNSLRGSSDLFAFALKLKTLVAMAQNTIEIGNVDEALRIIKIASDFASGGGDPPRH